MSLNLIPIKSKIFKARADIKSFVINALSSYPLMDGDILAITSKIVSLAEGCLRTRDLPKKKLIQEEADKYLGEVAYGCHLTIKNGHLLLSAGIDESNSEENQFICYPADPFKSAHLLRKALCSHYRLERLGIILTDSKTSPLRKGVSGISIGHAGFEGITDYIGKPDIFGRPLQMTQVNIVDSLAATSVLLMGEAAEQIPFVLIREANVTFTDKEFNSSDLSYKLEDDLYAPLLKAFTQT